MASEIKNKEQFFSDWLAEWSRKLQNLALVSQESGETQCPEAANLMENKPQETTT